MKATRLDQAAGSGRTRQHYIDWVRILAVLLLIPFHTARIFNLEEAGVAEPFYAKSQALSWPLSHFISFLDGWHMPLLFAVAGAATWYALGFRSGGQYIAAFCRRPGAIFLFAVPLLAASYLVPEAIDPNPLRHLLFFLAGYLLVADGRFQDAIDRHKGTALLLGIASAAILNSVWARGVDLGGNFDPQMIGVKLLGNLNSWLWVVAVLGYGRQFLNVNNRVLRYANEAAYPFYILHQTVIVAMGFYVLKWGLPVPAAFTFIALASLVASLALYDLLVKRVGVLRFLFGMKQVPAARALVQRQPVPATA